MRQCYNIFNEIITRTPTSPIYLFLSSSLYKSKSNFVIYKNIPHRILFKLNIMKSYPTVFLVVFLVLMTGCGYSFETDGTLDAYQNVVEKIRANNSVIDDGLIVLIYDIKDEVRRKIDYKPLLEASEGIQKISEELREFINEINGQFYDFVENEDDPFLKRTQELSKNKLRNQRLVNDFFITGYHDINRNFIEPKGEKIKYKLIVTHRKLIHVLDTLSSHNGLRITNEEKVEVASRWLLPKLGVLSAQNNWVDNTFSNKSVAATFANLALLENDALLTAQITIRYLGAKIGGCGPIFDKFMVVSSPRKNYVKMGETFQADIFLSAASSQAEVTAKINGKTYPVDRGVILYKIKPDRYGTHTYEAEISLKHPDTGRIETFTKTFQYEVGECYH